MVEITKEELQGLYDIYTREKLAKKLGMTENELRKLFSKLGVVNRKKRVISESHRAALKRGRDRYIKETGGSMNGKHVSDESKEKISNSLKVHYSTHKSKNIGRKLTEAQKKKQSESIKKAFSSPEMRKKISESAKKSANKRQQTCIDRYGVKNAWQLADRELAIQNMKKSRSSKGGDWYEANETVRIKIEEFSKSFKSKTGHLPSIMTIERNTNINHTIIGLAIARLGEEWRENYIKESSTSNEMPIYYFLKENQIRFVQHDRTQINHISPYTELDFYLPDYNVALEVNDVATHNSTFNFISGTKENPVGKPKDYHYMKTLACNKKGIRLIHIWEYEWNDKRQQEIIKNIILGACKKVKTRYYARKLKLKIIDKTDSEWKQVNKFFEENNVQGNRGGKLAVCLVDNDEIIMSYKYGSAFFGKGKYQWEVVRGATKLGCQVIGGASRIWKEFIRKYNPESIVYYVDCNYFNGIGVKNLEGIEYIGHSQSFKNYWIEEGKIKNREPSKNKEIKELVNQHKVVEIYPAGTDVYIWKNK